MKNIEIYFRVPISGYTLNNLKAKYRKAYGYKKDKKVTNQDISIWISSAFESDIQYSTNKN